MEAPVNELRTIDLGDLRLNRRAQSLLTRFAEDPQASIPVACRGWNETDVAYKFFAHPKVDAAKILQPHAEATRERCAKESVVLLVQDTTELDYSRKNLAVEGLGVLNRCGRRGMYLHVNLAFTPEGCCLGVLHAEFRRVPAHPRLAGRSPGASSRPASRPQGGVDRHATHGPLRPSVAGLRPRPC